MDLDEMTISDKINELRTLIAKANQDINYSTRVAWGDDPIRAKAEMEVIIDDAVSLFHSEKLKTLDLDIQEDAYANYNTKLDSLLRKFPEYALNQELSSGRRPM